MTRTEGPLLRWIDGQTSELNTLATRARTAVEADDLASACEAIAEAALIDRQFADRMARDLFTPRGDEG